MKILLVTNMYPTDRRPAYGIFVKEQVISVRNCYRDVDYDVYYINKEHSRLAYLKSIIEINKLINSRKYDLVHIHYGLSGLFLLNPIRTQIPIVLTLHGGDIQPEQGKMMQVALTHRILRKVDVAITLNDRMTGLASAYCKNVVQIPCSVNTEFFTPPLSRTLLPDRKELTIVFPGDKSRVVKNYPLFKETIGLLQKKHNILVNEVRLENMTREEVVKTLRGADFMLMTSISEGSPQAVKEAMSCNLPVISTKVGDVDVLLDNVMNSGWSELHISDALCDLMVMAMHGYRPGISGRDKIFQLGLDDSTVSGKIYDIYSSLING